MPRRLPLAAALLAVTALPATAATLIVDDPSPVSVPGHCTLVDAAQAISNQAAVNNCIAGDGNNDTIDLTGFTVPTTIAFNQPAPNFEHAVILTRAASIRGALDANGTPFVTLTRSDANGTPAVGFIDGSGSLTLYGLSLVHGAVADGGGAVLVGGDLTLDHCVLTNNEAGGGGAAEATGTLTIRNSIITGNSAEVSGGGVTSNGTVDVYASTLSNNQAVDPTGQGGGAIYGSGNVLLRGVILTNNSSAASGGAVSVGADATVIDSTLSGNMATGGPGGALFTLQGASVTTSTFATNTANATGGAISAKDADVENSTFNANAAPDGGAIQAGIVSLSYVTLSGNNASNAGAAAVTFTVSANANGTIAYGNTPLDLAGPAGASLTGQYNLIGQSGVAVPADTLTCDPQLGALGDNGGPTQTMAPATGSCVIDAGSSAPPVAVDQRHFARPATGVAHFRADIGAVEIQSSNTDTLFADNFE
jgi:hypothetical protein